MPCGLSSTWRSRLYLLPVISMDPMDPHCIASHRISPTRASNRNAANCIPLWASTIQMLMLVDPSQRQAPRWLCSNLNPVAWFHLYSLEKLHDASSAKLQPHRMWYTMRQPLRPHCSTPSIGFHGFYGDRSAGSRLDGIMLPGMSV